MAEADRYAYLAKLPNVRVSGSHIYAPPHDGFNLQGRQDVFLHGEPIFPAAPANTEINYMCDNRVGGIADREENLGSRAFHNDENNIPDWSRLYREPGDSIGSGPDRASDSQRGGPNMRLRLQENATPEPRIPTGEAAGSGGGAA